MSGEWAIAFSPSTRMELVCEVWCAYSRWFHWLTREWSVYGNGNDDGRERISFFFQFPIKKEEPSSEIVHKTSAIAENSRNEVKWTWAQTATQWVYVQDNTEKESKKRKTRIFRKVKKNRKKKMWNGNFFLVGAELSEKNEQEEHLAGFGSCGFDLVISFFRCQNPRHKFIGPIAEHLKYPFFTPKMVRLWKFSVFRR